LGGLVSWADGGFAGREALSVGGANGREVVVGDAIGVNAKKRSK
jgi:hypothetical protein